MSSISRMPSWPAFRLAAGSRPRLAVKIRARASRILVLANPVGIKVSDRETRDIADIFALTEEQFAALAYFDPAAGKHDYKTMPQAEVPRGGAQSRSDRALRLGAYMHDPKLKARLHRIRVPTLLLWGTADRILSQPYGQAYCAAIPGAALAADRARRPFPPSRAARRIRPAHLSPSWNGTD